MYMALYKCHNYYYYYYAIPKVRDICTFSVQFNFLVSQPCFPAHVFMKGTLCSVCKLECSNEFIPRRFGPKIRYKDLVRL